MKESQIDLWKSVVAGLVSEARRDNITLVAAGVSFYAVLAVLPGVILLLSIYGLFTDVAEAERQIDAILAAFPGAAERLIDEQMRMIAAASHPHLTVGSILSAIALFWTVSNAVKATVQAVKIAYNEDHKKSRLESRPVVLALSIAAVASGVVSLAIVAAVPVWFSTLDTDHVIVTFGHLRWLLIVGAFAGIVILLYRFAPPTRPAGFRAILPGVVLASSVWLLTSFGFSTYVASFGRYNETYGGLGGFIILMLWFWLATLAVILGAELNAVIARIHGTADPQSA